MDEEADFANLLSQSTIARPTWSTGAGAGPSSPDPWANPFSSESPTNPFASSTSAFGSTSGYVPAPSPGLRLDQAQNEESAFAAQLERSVTPPYVAQLEEDGKHGRGILPDPPSVIAAREQEMNEAESVFTNPYADTDPTQGGFQAYSPPPPQAALPPSAPQGSGSPVGRTNTRMLPSDLIDEDLLAASDPSISLKKAFVKSAPAPRGLKEAQKEIQGKKAYVFTPAKPETPSKVAAKERPETTSGNNGNIETNKEVKAQARGEDVKDEDNGDEPKTAEDKASESTDSKSEPASITPFDDKSTLTSQSIEKSGPPESIPLPASALPSPSISRAASPLPSGTPNKIFPPPTTSAVSDVFSPIPASASTPKHDRVAVSPLDPPVPAKPDYGFQALSIGGTTTNYNAPQPPPKSADWSLPSTSTTTGGSRFAGKGWAAVDEVDDLFGAGGPSVKSDPWGAGDGDGWAGDNAPVMASTSQNAMTSQQSSPIQSNSYPAANDDHEGDAPKEPLPTPSKRRSTMFQISVGDPTKVGDPIRGHTVYTVRTRTTSPHYRKAEISVLRRFSDFLWLFDALALNNPGVIVPPMPDKQPWGRFQDQFIETRRQALQRCLTKVTSHPILQLDPDLRLFLESDQFAMEAKNRKLEVMPEKTGLLAGWTGPKYFEQDDWFDSRKNFLEALESQLKGLSKSIETASKARLELAVSMGDFAATTTDLAESDLGSAMCAALARLADLARQEKEVYEDQAKGDVMTLLNMSDEYVRFIGSVRLAFAARIRAYHQWQNMEKEVGKMKYTREKLRQQGKLGDRTHSSLGEINEAERRVRDCSVDFENISKLIKSEFVRFERERVEEFKTILEKQLDTQIGKQRELIEAWEEYHGIVLKMVQKSQGR